MSLKNNIEHIAITPGIVSVNVLSAGEHSHRGDSAWEPMLLKSFELLSVTDEPTVRLVVGDNTIVVQSEGSETIAVVIPTGHAVAKSLRRMIRRMAKKDRGPVVAPSPRPAAPVAAAPVATPAAGMGATGWSR